MKLCGFRCSLNGETAAFVVCEVVIFCFDEITDVIYDVKLE